MRRNLPQQTALDKKTQIVVDRGQRNGWNAAPHRGENVLWRMMSVRGNDRFVHHLALMRYRQSVLVGQFTELIMGKAHDYRIRIIINDSCWAPWNEVRHGLSRTFASVVS